MFFNCSRLVCPLLVGVGCGWSEAIEVPPRMYGVVDGVTVTAAGEQLVIRGINLAGAAKSTEGHLFDVSDEVIAGLIADGIDSVRLLVFWDAVKPDGPDEFDEAYVAAVAQRGGLVGSWLARGIGHAPRLLLGYPI